MLYFFLFVLRGLDVHPQTLQRFLAQGDESSAQVLEVIYTDEITHVAAGLKWFTYICNLEQRVRGSDILVFSVYEGLFSCTSNTADLEMESLDFLLPVGHQSFCILPMPDYSAITCVF